MRTCIIMAGNSDDKLTQAKWCRLINSIDKSVASVSLNTYFRGHSLPVETWQNACWVVSVDIHSLDSFKSDLASIAWQFQQDSIAFVIGADTEFL